MLIFHWQGRAIRKVVRTWFWGGPLVYSVNGVYEVNDSASTVVTTDLRSESVRCLIRRAGGSSHRGGFKYAAHTPAAVCGWRPEQNLAEVVPEGVAVHVCVCVGLCAFVFWGTRYFFCKISEKFKKKCTSGHRFRHVSVMSAFFQFWAALGLQSGRGT